MGEIDTARVNGDLVAMTYRALKAGVGGVRNAKECLKLIMEPIEEQGQKIYRWQFFRVFDSSGVVIDDVTANPPKTFREFIEAPPLRGLGEKLNDIERLLKDDDVASVRLRDLTTGKKGNPTGANQYSGNADNVSISTDMFIPPDPAKPKADAGNSRAYTLSRLHHERPDLFEKVKTKEISANKAAILAGWRKPESALDTLKRGWRKASAEEQQEFLRWISNDA